VDSLEWRVVARRGSHSKNAVASQKNVIACDSSPTKPWRLDVQIAMRQQEIHVSVQIDPLYLFGNEVMA
jgi:hypothetical protein